MDKSQDYIRIARDVARLSPCRRRQYGAVLVKNGVIVSTGFNRPVDGEEGCCDNGLCPGEDCKMVHSEMSAILNARNIDLKGAKLYLAGLENGKPVRNVTPCDLCMRIVKVENLSEVVTYYGSYWSSDEVSDGLAGTV